MCGRGGWWDVEGHGRTSCGPMRQSILCQSRAVLGLWQSSECLWGSWSYPPRLESMVLCSCQHRLTTRSTWSRWATPCGSCAWQSTTAARGHALKRRPVLKRWVRKSSWGTACKTGNGSREKTFRRLNSFFVASSVCYGPKKTCLNQQIFSLGWHNVVQWCLSVYLSIYLSICLSVCLCCLSICLAINLSI